MEELDNTEAKAAVQLWSLAHANYEAVLCDLKKNCGSLLQPVIAARQETSMGHAVTDALVDLVPNLVQAGCDHMDQLSAFLIDLTGVSQFNITTAVDKLAREAKLEKDKFGYLQLVDTVELP